MKKIISLLLFVTFILFVSQTFAQQSEQQTTTSVVYNDGKVNYATSKVSFSLKSSDELSAVKSVMFKIDTGDYNEYKDPITINEEGLHSILYYSIDNVGNKTPENIYQVVIDNSAPEVNLIPSVKLFKLNDTLFAPINCEYSILASDLYSGVKQIESSIDAQPYGAYTAPLKLEAGKHTIKYRAIDNVGNVSAEKSIEIFVDNIPPEVKIVPSGTFFEKDGKKYAPKSFQYQIEATDSDSQVSKILVAIDSDNFVIYESPISFEKEGAHTIKAKAIDNVGNESAVVELSFIVDNTPPAIELTPATGAAK